MVKVPPPPPGGHAADVLVRVRQVHRDTTATVGATSVPAASNVREAPHRAAASQPSTSPAGAAVILASAETLATLDTPFYVTTTQGESRIELGGVVSRERDSSGATSYRVTIHFNRHAKLLSLGVGTRLELKLGETLPLTGFAGHPPSVLELTLEPAASAAGPVTPTSAAGE